jgi:hypothetical protein
VFDFQLHFCVAVLVVSDIYLARAAGTDSAAVSGNFFALPTVVRTVSPANARTT